MKKCMYTVLISFWFASVLAGNLWALQRAIRVEARQTDGTTRELRLYSGYYALVIGSGDYADKMIPDLPNAVSDAKEVANVLKQFGFEVKLVLNPNKLQMESALNHLIAGVGREREKAILIYYAGHGETISQADGTNLGYLLPVDTVHPERDYVGFLSTAISMKKIDEVSRLLNSKHVLMMFDSCFSGALFTAVRDIPKYITEKTVKPVREYITAGTEKETVPDVSIFKQVFLQGLTEGYADLNKDKYITGLELGMYLSDKVIQYSNGGQHPQFGKINHPALDKGDFVFVASSSAVVDKPSTASKKSTLSVEANMTGAKVYVDGQYLGQTPLNDRSIAPGRHRLLVKKEGYDPYQKRIQVEPGRSKSFYVDLSRAGPRKGRLYVETDPTEAMVRLLNIRERFQQGMDLDAGRYQVEVSAKGYETKKMWVSLDAGEDKSLDIRLNPVPKTTAEKEKTFTVGGVSFKMIRIPTGSFMMGSPANEPRRYSDEGPQHWVTLTRDFWMGETEVTQGLWETVMGNNPSMFKDCGDDCPVEKVFWNDAKEFIKKLNRMVSGGNFRLPTEAEWEYAARGGSTSRFSFGDDKGRLGQYAWYRSNSGSRTHQVAQKKPNAWGLYDMHGNVWEWCEDIYSKNAYSKHQRNDPIYTGSGGNRVIRGGSWDNGPGYVRSAYRGRGDPDLRGYYLGFRLARRAGGQE